MAGINEILIITTPEDQPQFQRSLATVLLSAVDLNTWRSKFPIGLARHFVLGADFMGRIR